MMVMMVMMMMMMMMMITVLFCFCFSFVFLFIIIGDDDVDYGICGGVALLWLPTHQRDDQTGARLHGDVCYRLSFSTSCF